ncbi:MAG: hypothetical protein IJS26_00765 [Alphaproteobacteria bacterium]|nr:hypothetical protein [Alphaproteobacteria bacterium]
MISKTARKKLFKRLFKNIKLEVLALQEKSGLDRQTFFRKYGFSEKAFNPDKSKNIQLGVFAQIQYMLSFYDLCLKIEFVPFEEKHTTKETKSNLTA